MPLFILSNAGEETGFSSGLYHNKNSPCLSQEWDRQASAVGLSLQSKRRDV